MDPVEQPIPTVLFRFGDVNRAFHIPVAVLMSLFVEFYETLELPMVPVTFTKDDVVLEAGAGIGYISSVLGIFADRVISLEAIPEYAEIAKANLEQNGNDNVTLISGVLGVGAGTSAFERRAIPYASSVLGLEWSHDEIDREISVPQYDINELVVQYGVNALHLDLEGGEALILPSVDFSPIRKVVMEFHPRVTGQAAAEALALLLLRKGFQAALIGGPRNFPTHSYTMVFAREPWATQIRSQRLMGDTALAKFEIKESTE